jgi:hypothetical protein
MTNSVRLIVIATSALTIFLSSVSMLDQVTNSLIQKEQIQIFHPLSVAYASSADEGSLRCSDGKPAASQDQCPATDQCPPPRNNTVSNCVSEAASTLASPDGEATTSNETSLSPDGEATTSNETSATKCFEDRFTMHTPQCTDSSSSAENVTLPS